jgi:hypothetical protein
MLRLLKSGDENRIQSRSALDFLDMLARIIDEALSGNVLLAAGALFHLFESRIELLDRSPWLTRVSIIARKPSDPTDRVRRGSARTSWLSAL